MKRGKVDGPVHNETRDQKRKKGRTGERGFASNSAHIYSLVTGHGSRPRSTTRVQAAQAVTPSTSG